MSRCTLEFNIGVVFCSDTLLCQRLVSINNTRKLKLSDREICALNLLVDILHTLCYRASDQRSNETTTTTGNDSICVRATNSNLTLLEWEEVILVFEHYDSRLRKFVCHSVALWIVLRQRLVELLALIELESEDSLNNVLALNIESTLIENTLLNQLLDDVRTNALCVRHLQIHTPTNNIKWRVARCPVRHNEATKVPLTTQNLLVEILALRCVNTIEEVVRGHNSSNICLLDSLLECREVDLVQSTLVDIRRYAVTIPLLVVTCEVLDTSHNAHTLHTLDISRSNLTCEEWVLTEVLKVTTTEWRTIDVCTRTEKDMHTTRTRVLTERDTHLLNQLCIPGCSSCNTTWIEGTLGVVTNTLRTVSHTNCWQAKMLDCANIPRCVTTYIGNLLIESHLLNNLGCAILVFLSHRITFQLCRY